MLRKLLPRTRSAFESRTQVWREVGLGSEIDPAAARRSKGGALLLLGLIVGVLVCFTERKSPLRYPPHTAVEELDRDDVVVRVVSTPMNPRDGGKLAEEVLAGLRGANGNGGPEPA